MKPKKPNVPVTMDAALLADIDKAADQTRSSRSEVMRQSMRMGLPLFITALGNGAASPAQSPKSARSKGKL